MLLRGLHATARRGLSTAPSSPRSATVIGSGCFGVGAAYFLARQGFQVTVLDKRDGVAQGTTWGNAASLRESSYGASAGPGAVPNMLKSIWNHDGTYRLRLLTLATDTWLWRWGLRFLLTCGDKSAIGATEGFLRDHSPYFNRLTRTIAEAEGFASKVDAWETGRDTMVVYVDCGADGKTDSAGDKPSDGTAAAYKAAKAKAAQPPPVPWAATTALTPAEAAAREPSLRPTLKGAMAGAVHPPHDTLIDSQGYTSQLAEVCKAKYGVRFVHGSHGTVTSLVHGAEGGVEAVQTADGTMHGSDVVVVASGAQAPRLLAPLGVDVPIYPVKGYSLTYDLGDDATALSEEGAAPNGLLVVEPAQMYVSRMGSRLRFTSIAEFSGWEEDAVAEDCVDVLRHRAESLFPAATKGRDAAVWCGGRPLTPDDRPVSGRMPAAANASNLYVHSGGGAYGWRVSMGVSQHLAAMIEDDGHAPPAAEAMQQASKAPSLQAAEPRTSFEPSLLAVERFRQLPLWPKALFGW